MPAAVPEVAIVTHNTDYYLLNLLDSLAPLAAAHAIGPVHVWDNGSRDLTAQLLQTYAARHAWVYPHRSGANVHHGPALDALLRRACQSEWVLLLDSDTEVQPSLPQALAALPLSGAAFAGQIHPQMPQLYAYLAHLLVHRPTYLQLPPFCHDGAPGVDYFREIERQQRPFVRFRWSDHVRHFGQGALRRLLERGDRDNEFYGFANVLERTEPRTQERLAIERALQVRLKDFLQDGARDTTGATPARVRAGDVAPASVTRARPPRRSWQQRLTWLTAPRAARWLREARRLGLTQVHQEALDLVHLVTARQPRRVLEIGTAHGGSFLLWARAARPDATLVSVDLPPWEMDDPAEESKKRRLAAVASSDQRVHLIRGSSHDSPTRARVRECFAGAPIDFLFIDGDHSFEGVAADFHDYSPLVAPGGIVALHDIHPHSRGWGGEVPAFWQSIRGRYNHTELVADRKQDGFGIGIIWM